MWREAHSGLSGFDAAEARDVVTRFPRFLRSGHHDVPALIRSELPKYSHRRLLRQAQALVPPGGAVHCEGEARDLRTTAAHGATGKLVMDFVVRGDENSTHLQRCISSADQQSGVCRACGRWDGEPGRL